MPEDIVKNNVDLFIFYVSAWKTNLSIQLEMLKRYSLELFFLNPNRKCYLVTVIQTNYLQTK